MCVHNTLPGNLIALKTHIEDVIKGRLLVDLEPAHEACATGDTA